MGRIHECGHPWTSALGCERRRAIAPQLAQLSGDGLRLAFACAGRGLAHSMVITSALESKSCHL